MNPFIFYDIVSDTNTKLVSSINVANIGKVVGWIVFAVLLIGGGFFGYMIYRDRKTFRKKVTAFEIVGGYYCPAIRDTAKTVKIGTGGFEILFLKKAKTWKVAYGVRVGKDTYYFFIGKDGYWFNGMLSGDINQIDKDNGLVPIITTNPSMRAQYTSLEKQIDSLHADKKSFMEKYGTFIMSISFIIIVGVFAMLLFKEVAPLQAQFGTLMDSMTKLVDKLTILTGNIQSTAAGTGGTNGLIPVH